MLSWAQDAAQGELIVTWRQVHAQMSKGRIGDPHRIITEAVTVVYCERTTSHRILNGNVVATGSAHY